MRSWVVSMLCVAAALLAGCARIPLAPAEVPRHLLHDDRFVPQAPIDTQAVFAMSPAMRAYLETDIEPKARRQGLYAALTDALFTRGRLRLDYDSESTRNAAEAFDARAGNCLSLTIMTGAFAHALGLEIHYQNVLEEEAWDRQGDLQFFIGHVNVRMGRLTVQRSLSNAVTESLTVDFLPGQDLGRQRVEEISEERVLAMYLNNRAAELLVAGRLDEAYAFAREGLFTDPGFWAVYNTLGIIYMRHGALPEAEAALRFVQAREPANPHVLGNLALALIRQGREAEAQPLLAEQHRLQPTPPFALFREGLQAMREGQYLRARQLFEREVSRAPDYHEFHFWLAQAQMQLGDLRAARRELERALEASTTREQGRLYSAKLERLKAAAKL